MLFLAVFLRLAAGFTLLIMIVVVIARSGVAVTKRRTLDRSASLTRFTRSTGCILPAMLGNILSFLSASMAALVAVAVIIMLSGCFSYFAALVAGFVTIAKVGMLKTSNQTQTIRTYKQSISL